MSVLSRLLHHGQPGANERPAPPQPAGAGYASRPGSADGDNAMREHLARLAEAQGLPGALVHRLEPGNLHACRGLPTAVLRAYLHALSDTADRNTGKCPPGYTARACCKGCGHVWLPPAALAGACVVAGLPRVAACPWCHVRGAGGQVPRPAVTGTACQHWTPDSVNPRDGIGRCRCGGYYPQERHPCGLFEPKD